MNNVLERVEKKLIDAGFYGSVLTARNASKVALTAICDEIDEGGIDIISLKQSVSPTMCKIIVQGYLSHIKSTTETKGAV